MKRRRPKAPAGPRRERPDQPALSRQAITEAALALFREEGLSRVTMRRVAEALDTGPSSLYVHVRDTEDLHAQILDAQLGALRATKPRGGSWRRRLKARLAAYRDVLIAHPELARMALSTQPSGPNYMALAEDLLALLREGNVGPRQAAWGLDLLLLLPTAIAVERVARERPEGAPDERSELAREISNADPARFPQIVALGGLLLSGSGPQRFDWAVDVLLDGVLAAPKPPTRGP